MTSASWHRAAPLGAGDFPTGTPLHRFFAWNEAARHKDRRYVIARDIDTLFAAFGGGETARELVDRLLAAVGSADEAAHAAVFAAFEALSTRIDLTALAHRRPRLLPARRSS